MFWANKNSKKLTCEQKDILDAFALKLCSIWQTAGNIKKLSEVELKKFDDQASNLAISVFNQLKDSGLENKDIIKNIGCKAKTAGRELVLHRTFSYLEMNDPHVLNRDTFKNTLSR